MKTYRSKLMIFSILFLPTVSEVLEGDSYRKVIEMIFRSGWTSFENQARIERILTAHNPQAKLPQFEEYREMVKIRANRLQHSRKYPRCLADGNELLRFHGTTLSYQLGIRGIEDHSLFSIFTTSTSERAYRSIEIEAMETGNPNKASRRALVVYRVYAGRVHKPTFLLWLFGTGTPFETEGIPAHTQEFGP
ncbi:hypothetical protein Cgig2_004254 [Carnegiea gigantea]|uniref:Uncharacterized protein n=1 Tax=Carnegiea gigantea TaxID=171969 RepID=A0A9Q1KHN5_9CARY|nr:hypothetical protein Cgig2_004254 [Carnegiea gigantea]